MDGCATVESIGGRAQHRRRHVAVVGAGVVGAATGAGLAAVGHEVTLCDAAPARRAELRQRGFRTIAPARLAECGADTFLLSVPTPTIEGRVDLSYVLAAAETVGEAIGAAGARRRPLVVVRSTIPPGTTEGCVRETLERASGRRAGSDFGLCMNPEFLREASAEQDFMEPRVIVIGAIDARSDRSLRQLYRPWPDVPVVSLDLRSAELTKYVSNLYNAAKISFFNDLADVAQSLRADPRLIFPAVALGAEGMWNPHYGTRALGPFGGACLPKDTSGFLGFAEDAGLAELLPMLRATIETNARVAERVRLVELVPEAAASA